jgi:hypothetical protein
MLVHGGDLIHGDDALRCRGSITRGALWTHRVVVPAPLLDDNAGYLQCVEDLAVQQFVPIADLRTAVVEPSGSGTFWTLWVALKDDRFWGQSSRSAKLPTRSPIARKWLGKLPLDLSPNSHRRLWSPFR